MQATRILLLVGIILVLFFTPWSNHILLGQEESLMIYQELGTEKVLPLGADKTHNCESEAHLIETYCKKQFF